MRISIWGRLFTVFVFAMGCAVEMNAGTGPGITLAQRDSLDAGNTNAASLAFVSNNTAGNWIAVCIRAGAMNETFRVTDSRGNTYRQAIQFTETGDGNTIGIFYAENISAGVNTVTVSDTAADTLRFVILEYAGVATSGSLDGIAVTQGNSASANSGSAVTTANGDLLLGMVMTGNATTYTAGTGYQIEGSVPAEPGTKFMVEDQVQAAAGSASASATLGTGNFWAAGMAAFKASTPSTPPSTGVPISLVQHNSVDAGQTNAASLAFVSNNTAGNWIAVCVRAGAMNETFRVTDSRGNTYRQAIQFTETGDGNTIGIFYAENISAGVNTVTVSDTAADTLRFVILEYAGVATSGSLDGIAVTQGNSASANSGSAVTTANGDLLLGMVMTGNATTYTAGTGYQIEGSVPAEPGTKFMVEDQVQAAAGSASASATLSAGNFWAAGMAAFKAVTNQSSMASGPLRVLSSNPRYFTDGSGKAILLAGSHTWSNGTEDRGTINPPPAFNYDAYMTFMASHNFNWMRLWTTEMAQVSTSNDPYEDIIAPPYKWARSSTCCANDGGNRFDFTQLDPNYFSRLRARIIQAGQNGIYVSVMLFNGYMWQFDEMSSDGNPFEAGNNVNGINCGGTCPSDNSQLPAAAWDFEKAYLQKVVDTVNDLPNVMYEVSNEAGSPYSDSWQASIISFVKQYEATKPLQHPVGMTYQYEGGTDTTLYNSQADWISPQTEVPPDATGGKVVIVDTDHAYCWSCMKSNGQTAQMEWVWKNFAHGNSVAFMDPYLVLWSGRNACTGTTSDPYVCTTLDPYWDVIRNAMTDIRNYATKIDLADMTPQDTLSTSGFCLANPGSQYLIFSTSNSFTLNAVAGSYAFEWFNPATHTIVQTGTVTVGGSQNFTAPFGGDAVLWLHK